MKPVAMDPCLWYRKDNHDLSGILALQVDDTLYGGDPKFQALEIDKSNMFPNSGRTSISQKPTRFNGLDLSTIDGILVMDQKYYFDNLPKKNIGKLDFTEFRSLRQKVAYASYSSMPDILIYVARMSQYRL